MFNLLLIATLSSTVCNDGYITLNESHNACQNHNGERTLTPNNLYSPVLTWDYTIDQESAIYSFGFSKPAEALNFLALQHPTPRIGIMCFTTADFDNKNILWRFSIISKIPIKSAMFRSLNEIWFLNSPHELSKNDNI